MSTWRDRARSSASPARRASAAYHHPEDPQELIVDETFQSLPTPMSPPAPAILPGKIAAHLRRRPRSDWTPKILDKTKQKQEPGTFFMIGENAMAEQHRKSAAWWTKAMNRRATLHHPNLALTSSQAHPIELGAHAALIEAYTGRSVRLPAPTSSVTPIPPRGRGISPRSGRSAPRLRNVGLRMDPNDLAAPGEGGDRPVATLREVGSPRCRLIEDQI